VEISSVIEVLGNKWEEDAASNNEEEGMGILMFISASDINSWDEASNNGNDEPNFNSNGEGFELVLNNFSTSEVSVINEWVEGVEWGIVGGQEHEVEQDDVFCYHIKYQKGDHR